MRFQLDHISSLFKYTGISFTAGAITHGFFSEERSFWTAILGIFLYLIGSVIAKLANPQETQTWSTVLIIGIFASIGLGFFTGGLQHFPDSPARSVWVVPLGFLMSLIAVYLMEGKGVVTKKSATIYAVVGGIFITVASLLAYEYYHAHGVPHDASHSHQSQSGENHSKSHGHGGDSHKH
jgi:hypothetical protein